MLKKNDIFWNKVPYYGLEAMTSVTNDRDLSHPIGAAGKDLKSAVSRLNLNSR